MRIVALAAAFAFLAGSALADPQVKIEQGALSGAVDGGISVFRDIPFAAPPVGDLRWRSPQPAPAWTGTRDATLFGPVCPQALRTDGKPVPEKHTENEDCLTANVWTPNTGGKLPVMVWIYGGSFRQGGSAFSIYDGMELAQHGVVVMTFNYRLGWLGFLDMPSLAAEHSGEPHGNYGLMDQVAALKWVQKNIASFGGDPSNVTIFGESAGGMSVNDLMVSPLARGLFDKAISESGLGLIDTPTETQAQMAGAGFAKDHDAEKLTGAEQMKALRDLSVASIINGHDADSSGPMVDGTVLPDSVAKLFSEGKIAKAAYMAGSNSDEASLMSALGMKDDDLLKPLGDQAAAVRAIYEADGKLDDTQFVRQLFDDGLFASGAQAFAHYAARTGEPAYVYHFRYIADPLRGQQTGVPHGGEIVYVFGLHGFASTPRGKLLASYVTDKDKGVIAMMENYWSNFAKTGDPNGAGLPQWPQSSAAAPQTLVVDDQTKAVSGFRKNQLAIVYGVWTKRTAIAVP
jgi:para-nitrobenzyl esterase